MRKESRAIKGSTLTLQNQQCRKCKVKVGVFLAVLGAALFYISPSAGSPELLTFKSALVWRQDNQGDYIFEIPASAGRYEIDPAHITEGRIETISASWAFKGEVSLEVSADDGAHYTAVVNGVPLTSGFVRGNRLKWRASLGPDSELEEVRISYTDTSGVVETFGEPRLSGFQFRKALSITRQATMSSDEDLFNYQVKIKVAESAGAPSFDVHCGGDIQADFKDIRFSCADGETILPHYLEKIEGTSPNRVATFWVKIPQIPPDGVGIYIYYGNPAAEDLSSGEAVFDFFDEFEGSELDLERWEVREGAYTVTAGQLKLEGAEILSKEYQIKDGIIEYRARAEAGNEIRVILRSKKEDVLADAEQVAYSSTYQGAEHCLAVDNIVKANQPRPIASGTTYDYRVILQEANLTFQRYSPDYGELEAEVTYDDVGGIERGNIGLKAGAGCTNYFAWVRARRYSPYPVGVDREAAEQVVAEQIDIPEFSGVKLAKNGNLILEDESTEGAYTSRTISLPFNVRILIPSWKETKEGIKLAVSLDGGLHFAPDLARERFYYASRGDFTPGKELKFKLELLRDADEALQLEQISIDYRPGKILLVSPNGGEIWQPQQQKEITWVASEYEPDYRLSLEYSLNGGKTYKVITEATENDGAYFWAIPDVDSKEVLVRISDALDPKVYDISDGLFSISTEERVTVEEAVVEEEAPAEGLEKEEIDLARLIAAGERPGTQLYDLLIKLGDNTHPDPEEDTRACYKHGDIVVVKPAGHNWSAAERNSFLILQVYLREEEVQELTCPEEIATGKLDESGRPVMERVRRRAKRIDLGKLGLSEDEISDMDMAEREERLRAIRNLLKDKIKDKTLAPDVRM